MKFWTLYVHMSPSDKTYVGITSQTPAQRWKNGKGYRNSVKFNKAIEKYGWENFRHIIVRDDLTEHQAKLIEMYLIKKLKSNTKQHGYNITCGGDGTLGRKHKESSKLKMSIAKVGKSINVGEKNGMYGRRINLIPVRCVTTGIEYDSYQTASEDNNLGIGTLSKMFSQGRNTCKGLEWELIQNGL